MAQKGRYTELPNKIGLYNTSKGSFIKNDNDVVLSFPFKDAVLEAGMSKEDVGRDERFLHQQLDSKDIDTLEEPKVLTNFKLVNKDGEINLTENSDVQFFDEEGNLVQNLLIKGNNLLALYTLRERLAGKVKLIYIDPPYYFDDTKPEDSFLYNSNFKLSAWLTFMKDRLDVARDLLSDDGAILVQINDDGYAYMKVLMDELYPEGFINSVGVKTKSSAGASGGGEDKRLKKNLEFILLYAKNREVFSYKPAYVERPLEDVIADKEDEGKQFEYSQVLYDEGEKIFFKSIKDGSGQEIKVYKHNNYSVKSAKQLAKDEGKTREEVYSEYFDKIFRGQPAQSSIRTRVNEANNYDKGLFSIEYIPKSGKNKGGITTNYYLKNDLVNWLRDTAQKTKSGKVLKKEKAGTLWSDLSWNGLSAEGGVQFKGGKKPERLLERIVGMFTEEGDVVLDFCLGSASTVAVAHKMNRRWVGVEQMDYVETVSKKRLENVVNGDQSGVSKKLGWNGGGSFAYFELKKYNQEYIDAIMEATSIKELEDLYIDMRNNAFLKFWFDRAEFEKDENFRSKDLDGRKQALADILDENQLYLNYADMNDTRHTVSTDEKALTGKFYGENEN